MFTQCPQCEAAFRITAEVLQQARGQVRCGSCDLAFNALDHLYEEPPASRAARGDTTQNESNDTDEQSQALLKTLDRLAGPDEVRIEDTGVEWIVVDEDDLPEQENTTASVEATGSIKWLLEDPNAGAGSIDAVIPEVSDVVSGAIDPDAEETAEQPVLDEQAALKFAAEPRYDDNTPLPDDFEEQHDYVPAAPTPQRRADDAKPASPPAQDESQAELELSEPDEWTDLLDEVAPPAVPTANPAPAATVDSGSQVDPDHGEFSLEVEEELAAIHDELSGLPESTVADLTRTLTEADVSDSIATLNSNPEADADIAEVASQLDDLLEAMGSGQFGGVAAELEARDQSDDSQTKDRQTDDQTLQLVEDAVDVAAPASNDQTDAHADAEAGTPADTVTDESADKQFDSHTPAINDDEPSPPPDGEHVEAAVEEQEKTEPPATTDGGEDKIEQADLQELDADAVDALATEYEESTGEFERAIADAEDEILAERARADTVRVDNGSGVENSGGENDSSDFELNPDLDLEEDTDDRAGSDDTPDTDDADHDLKDDLAAMTGNMKIDADLLRAMKDDSLAASMTNEDGSPVFETIVMEGDFVRGALDAAIDTDNRQFSPGSIEPPPDLADPGSLVDTYMMRRNDAKAGKLFSGKSAIIGIIVLALLLVAQFIHTSRESLATFGAFNQTVAPLYRLFGSPVTPTWDIKGWQFEATNGSTDETDSLLTVYSRISNRSSSALPYPLVHISLTDRYEEIVGSRVLEPNEYLAGNADPSRPVAAGDNFTAVITITAPSDEATGFKLNVCYRVLPGRVRCAVEDFKAP